ncbi:hypothetical protein ALC60_12517, partial [Trachymyrmex zeteki]
QRQGENSIALDRRRQRDIELPLFASAPRYNQIDLMPMPRFLLLEYSLYFRDPQTTQRRKRTDCTHAHMAPCLRRRKKTSTRLKGILIKREIRLSARTIRRFRKTKENRGLFWNTFNDVRSPFERGGHFKRK